MADVTKNNFSHMLEEFRSAVSSCDFISVDCEFSGLDDTICRNNFDIPEIRYRRCRKDVSQYSPIQIGLTTFEYSGQTKSHTARPFNFYIFPHINSRIQSQSNLTCNTASLLFLVNQGFDLNKMVSKGIPFLSIEKELLMLEKINAINKKEESRYSPEKEREKIKAEEVNQAAFLKQVRQSLCALAEAEDDSQEVEFKDHSSFHRSLIFAVVASEFSHKGIVALSKVDSSKGDGKQRYVLARKINIGDDSAQLKLEKAEKLRELQEAVGFTEAMKIVAESRKVLVGHNMLHDLMHIHNAFLADLPEDYHEFKESLLSVFPKICDTKVFANTKPLKDHVHRSGLDQLFSTISQKPFRKPLVTFPEDFKKYESAELSHEAGYDSYMTGVIFISLLNYLGSLVKPPKSYVPCSSDLLKPFVNKIYIMGVNDMYYLDLENEDLLPSREDTFFLTFPQDWKTQDIVNLFEKFSNDIKVRWKDSMSAFAQLANLTEPCEAVLKSVRKLCKRQQLSLSIATFDEWASGGSGDRQDSNEDSKTPNRKSNGKRSSNDSIAELESVEEIVTPSGKKAKTV